MKKLSIIVPVFNTAEYLERCLLSLVNQHNVTKNDYEIIVINDGSSDDSEIIMEKFKNTYPSLFHIFSQSNQGLSITRNLGINRASGEYLWFVDSDDYVSPNSLEELFRCMASEVDGIALSYTLTYDDKEDIVITMDSTCENGIDLLIRSNHNPAQFCVFRKEYLLNYSLKFMEDCFHEDVEFSTKAKYLAKKIRVISTPIYKFYQRPVSTSRGNVNPKRAFDCLKIAFSLYSFAKDKCDKSDYYLFANAIGIVVNIALSLSKYMNNNTTKRFMEEFCQCSNVTGFMIYNKRLLLKIEGILGNLFPKFLVYIKKHIA